MKPRWVSQAIFLAGERLEGRVISGKFRTLLDQTSLDPAEHRRRNRQKLVDLVEYAGVQVPYYRQLFKKIDFSVEKLKRDFKYFQDIPYLTKEVILGSQKQFIAEPFLDRSLHERKTSGSTGPSLSIFYDQEALDWTAAINLYVHSMAGRKIFDREALLSSDLRLFHASWKTRILERMKCLVLNRANVLTQKFDDEGLAKIYAELLSAQPFLVQGQPSTIYALALYLRDRGIQSQKLFEVFESTGESLDREKVDLIEKHIGCRVYNRYGNAEFGVIAHSVERFDRLRVVDESVYVENFIYGAGIPELVCTGLLNRVMPLIRYRTGDIAEVEYQNDVPYLRNLTGRIHDVVEVGGSPYSTHFIKDVLQRAGGVDEFQFIRKQAGDLELNLVLNTHSKQEQVISALKRVFNESIQFKFVRMSELKRVGWNDKFKYVINE